MNNSVELRIEQSVLDSILSAARKAGSQECMGLLASGAGKGALVTGACLLPAQASGGHAEADPLTIRQAVEFFCKRRQRPLGLWHSHGGHDVFHSATDDHTVMRLLPAMAEWSLERVCPVWPAPAVTGADTAIVPLNDGRWLRLTLLGPSVPGMDHGHERAAWESFDVAFCPERNCPQAAIEAGSLRLSAGGVELRLGVPEGATVISSTEDHAPLRSAHLLSLVVNRRGDRYAEVVSVHDLDGEFHMTKRTCRVAVIPDHESNKHEHRVVDLATCAESLCLVPALAPELADDEPHQKAAP